MRFCLMPSLASPACQAVPLRPPAPWCPVGAWAWVADTALPAPLLLPEQAHLPASLWRRPASLITGHPVGCRGGLPPTFFVPELAQFEARNTTLRELGQNSRGENLPEWWALVCSRPGRPCKRHACTGCEGPSLLHTCALRCPRARRALLHPVRGGMPARSGIEEQLGAAATLCTAAAGLQR